VWFLCAPLAIFMIFYREALIKLLFYGGNFTYDNVLATADTMLFYAMGIPAFCATKVLLPAFYARKKMTLPLIFSLICMTLNIPLSILLMLFLQQGGIALATVLTAVLNNLLLLYFLKRDNFAPDTGVVLTAIFRSLIFAAAAAAPALYYRQICVWCRPVIIPAVPELMPLMFCGIFFGIVYLLLSYISGAPEVREICSSLIARKSRKKEK
jgi:putative peptidoglycan lipid II flippase